MKQWIWLAVSVGILALGCAGCGTQEAKTAGASAEVSERGAETESEEAQTEQEDRAAREQDNGGQAESASGNEGNEVIAFAEKIRTAMAEKDMEAIADLCSYPVGVNGEVVEDRDAFMELGADTVFTEERCAAIAAVDVSTLEETMAGVIMGEATPNIIFKSVDGTLGITGIN